MTDQRLAVATVEENLGPYGNLVAFAHNGAALTEIYFATLSSTRKYCNLKSRPRVALVIDRRPRSGEAFDSASALTVSSKSVELAGPGRDAAPAIYKKANPELDRFASAPSCALFRLMVEKYILVEHFEQVTEFEPVRRT